MTVLTQAALVPAAIEASEAALPTRPARPRGWRVVGMIGLVALALVAAACMPPEARTFLDRTNSMRAAAGVHGLAEHDTLTRKAEQWAQHMAASGQLGHSQLAQGLEGLSWRALTENVAVSDPTGDTLLSLHNALANSPQHRQNLLSGEFTHMGVGVATGPDGRVWVTEVFAGL